MHFPSSIRDSPGIWVLIEHRVIRGEGASGARKKNDGSPRDGTEGKGEHVLERYFAGDPNTSTSM